MRRVTNYRGQAPRQLTPEDIASFDQQFLEKPPPNREQMIEILKRRNPVRWWRLQSDYRWMRRELKKAGRNPEDARWMFP